MVWVGFSLLCFAAYIASLMNSIFKEVRSIRVMMNADRQISNEFRTFDED